MWLLAAADQPVGTGDETAIILGVVGALSLVLVAAVSGIFALLTARANRTAPAAPPSTPSGDLAFRDYVVGELAVGRQRDDDSDERDEIQDRELRDQRTALDEHHGRLRRIERHLELPDWTHDAH